MLVLTCVGGLAISIALFLVHLYAVLVGSGETTFTTVTPLTLLACFCLLGLVADRVFRLSRSVGVSKRSGAQKEWARRGAARLHAWVSSASAFGVMAIMVAAFDPPATVLALGFAAALVFAACMFILEDRRPQAFDRGNGR